MTSQTVRFFFGSLDYAAQALLTTLTDMRETKNFYSIQGLEAETILQSGLVLTGDVQDIAKKLEKIPTAIANW